MDKLSKHKTKVNKIAELIKIYSLSKKENKLHFYHGSSNSTRPKNKQDQFINISTLNEVISVNFKERYALVEPNVSVEELVKITAKYGLMPLVVMEFPKITCGGAINGASLESSSFKYGQLCDTCEEYEIILGNGEVITASKNINAELFYGISGSYGSLGLITLIKINLVESTKYIKTTYYPTQSFQETLEYIRKETHNNDIDYLDAIIFNPSQGVVITGKRTNEHNLPIKTYSKITDLWFYEQAKIIAKNNEKSQELIPTIDYLFRYDRGAFWMGEFAFPLLGIPNNKLTRFLFNGYAKTHKLFEALQTLNVSQNYFLQDIYFPFKETLSCLEYNEKTLGIYPLWLCPVKPTNKMQKLSPHFINAEMLIDVGIWGQTNKYLSDPVGINKNFEKFSSEHSAKKMLYAHAYYSEGEFWNIYDKDWYIKLREKYYAVEIFPDVWSKTHVSGRIMGSRWLGFLKYFFINPIKKQLHRLY